MKDPTVKDEEKESIKDFAYRLLAENVYISNMKYINEQKVINKLRELLGPRCMDLQVDYGNRSALAIFSLSDVYIPNKDLP